MVRLLEECKKGVFMIYDNETEIYIKQLEDENLRLKNSNRSLRNNNKGLLQGLNKINSQLRKYKKIYGELKQ